jgi:hypothetical protein
MARSYRSGTTLMPPSGRIILGLAALAALSVAVGYWSIPARGAKGTAPASLSGTTDPAQGSVSIQVTTSLSKAIAYRNAKRGASPPWPVPPPDQTEADAWAKEEASARRESVRALGDSPRWSQLFSPSINPALTEALMAARREEYIEELRMDTLPLTYRFALAEFLLLVDSSPGRFTFPGGFLTPNYRYRAEGVKYNAYRDRHVNLAAHTLSHTIGTFPLDASDEQISKQLSAEGWKLYPEDLAYVLGHMRPFPGKSH